MPAKLFLNGVILFAAHRQRNVAIGHIEHLGQLLSRWLLSEANSTE